jgi:hypothetical protein
MAGLVGHSDVGPMLWGEAVQLDLGLSKRAMESAGPRNEGPTNAEIAARLFTRAITKPPPKNISSPKLRLRTMSPSSGYAQLGLPVSGERKVKV